MLQTFKKKKKGNNDNVKKPNKGTIYFKIFHQNIRGLGKKAGELLTHLHPDFPHVILLLFLFYFNFYFYPYILLH